MQTTENLAFVGNTVEKDRNQRGLHSIEKQKQSVETQRRAEPEKKTKHISHQNLLLRQTWLVSCLAQERNEQENFMEIKYCMRCIFNKVYSFILAD